MSRLSTHVLDTSRGLPAAGIEVSLHAAANGGYTVLGQGVTDADGRIPNLVSADTQLAAGDYRLRFATGAYFQALGLAIFYPEVQIDVRLDESKSGYHLPLLLSPYGYSTYRGS
ncbi:MAG TPA: hydroxyisourate hydrolase [Gemmataceae bacterium]|jgi:5-hydroxyisourate hydrolase|nr:hydroxyisourate hydrolase [Gemmataceae bacterium]